MATLELPEIAQRLGPREKKQSVQMIGLGVDFGDGTTEGLERVTQIGMEVGANLVGARFLR